MRITGEERPTPHMSVKTNRTLRGGRRKRSSLRNSHFHPGLAGMLTNRYQIRLFSQNTNPGSKHVSPIEQSQVTRARARRACESRNTEAQPRHSGAVRKLVKEI
ncbi:hypothetical protein CLAIMM_11548 isoform 1 [Cladophialophora immunda]|nr:hypothetical protein CLAIMM_11548 isoform 1 [Cladophialophora immunda]